MKTAEGEAADAPFVAWAAKAAIPESLDGSGAAFEAAAQIVSPVGSIAAVQRILRRDQQRREEDEDSAEEGVVGTELLLLLGMYALERIDVAMEGTNIESEGVGRQYLPSFLLRLCRPPLDSPSARDDVGYLMILQKKRRENSIENFDTPNAGAVGSASESGGVVSVVDRDRYAALLSY